MGFNCGIVGLPNVGKSTLFNALTKAGAEAANYPFCTIEPNVGIVPVPEPRLQKLADIVKPKQIVPAVMEFVDIAGLVAGAAKGEGLGNQFLAHIRETQAIAHVVRCFEDENVTHVSGTVDPESDIETINTELVLSDLATIAKAINRTAKIAKSGDKDAIIEKALFEKMQTHLDSGNPARTFDATPEEKERLFHLHLLTSKPVLYIANLDENISTDNHYLKIVEEIAAKENAIVVTISASIEAEIAELAEEEKAEFLQELGIKEPGLHRLIQAGYALLGLKTYFTAGPKEVRAWTFRENATAPEAAGVIHTDFQRGFIRAEVISYEDYIQYNGEQGAKEAGKLRSEGKSYVVQDGDIMHFRFNV